MHTPLPRLPRRRRLIAVLFGLALLASPPLLAAQLEALQTPPGEQEQDPAEPKAADKVEVEPVARDEQIRQRLLDILRATQWYQDVSLEVRDGVVFLDGRAENEAAQEFASETARNTEGVVAVVNRMQLDRPPMWDFSPARLEAERMARGFVQSLPIVVIALLILGLAWLIAKLAAHAMRRVFGKRLTSNLLREVAARAVGIFIFLIGLYLVLRIAGLTRLAITVLGGTGLLGLILGIAFRDITENFLASLFLSMQQPFREGDLVDIAGVTGYIQRLNSRTTVLMTLDGSQVQIPNSTIFKSTIYNYTSNPNRRQDFTIGIGYDDPIPFAQEVALDVLAQHPAILQDPEPWVLVDELGSSSVVLRIYFWMDGSRHSWLKVRSAVIRLIKRRFQQEGISMPDAAREIIFPRGVPVHMLDDEGRGQQPAPAPATPVDGDAISTRAEGHLQSEASDIKKQASRAWLPEQGENLLSTTPESPPTDSG